MRTWMVGALALLLTAAAQAQEEQKNWVVRQEPAAATLRDVSPEEDERYWAVVRQLTDAFNDEDSQAYMSLLSERLKTMSKFPLEDLMDFMSGVVARRGAVASFHAMKPKGLVVPDSEFLVRNVIFHLEDGTPGLYGIALDVGDKIDHFSLFVKEGICRHGSGCPEAVVKPGSDE